MLDADSQEWESQLLDLVKSHSEYDPPEMYCLRDNLKAKYGQPYFPERESDEQAVINAIRLAIDGSDVPVEISEMLPRLRPVTERPRDRTRYYVPKEIRTAAETLRREWQ